VHILAFSCIFLHILGVSLAYATAYFGLFSLHKIRALVITCYSWIFRTPLWLNEVNVTRNSYLNGEAEKRDQKIRYLYNIIIMGKVLVLLKSSKKKIYLV
jgi:hypothetical protein